MKQSLVRLLRGCSVALLVALAAPATSLAIDEFPIPNPCAPAPPPETGTCQPGGITAGPDGALWFTEENGNRIGRITTAGADHRAPRTLPAGSRPSEIIAGPDGGCGSPNQAPERSAPAPTTCRSVITLQRSRRRRRQTGSPPARTGTSGSPRHDWGPNRIGQTAHRDGLCGGASTRAFGGSGPADITVGPDNRLWFTEVGPTRRAIDHVPRTRRSITRVRHFRRRQRIRPASPRRAGALWLTKFGATGSHAYPHDRYDHR